MRNISRITDHRLAEVARFPMQSLREQGFDADYFSRKSHANEIVSRWREQQTKSDASEGLIQPITETWVLLLL